MEFARLRGTDEAMPALLAGGAMVIGGILLLQLAHRRG